MRRYQECNKIVKLWRVRHYLYIGFFTKQGVTWPQAVVAWPRPIGRLPPLAHDYGTRCANAGRIALTG